MSTLTCDEVEMALPALALGALDDNERSDVLEHLGNCHNCRIKLAEYHLLTNQMLQAVPQVVPPPALRKAILAKAEPAKERWTERVGRWLNGRQTLPRWSFIAALIMLVVILSVFGSVTVRLANQ